LKVLTEISEVSNPQSLVNEHPNIFFK